VDNAADDARITADGYFALRRGQDGISDVYYFLNESFDLADSLVHNKLENTYENIDGHCVYKDDSLTIYILERILPLANPVYLNDIGTVNYILDNIIIAKLNGQIILEYSNYDNFAPKYLLGEAIDTLSAWDIAHVNSVSWDGTGIIVSSLCYGIYKIDLDGEIVWEQDSLTFVGPVPVKQHDLEYLGNGLYSVFSNGDGANQIFAATFTIENDSVKYDYMHLPRLTGSPSMGNFQYNGIINYGAHEAKFIFPDTSMRHRLKANEYAYRAALHDMQINASITHVGDSLIYTPLNEYSTYVWSNGEMGDYIDFTTDTVSVTETTPLGFIVYTERYFGPTSGINEPNNSPQSKPGQPYNILGQPCEPNGLYIKDGKKYYTPR
jgi:hypothetical protein